MRTIAIANHKGGVGKTTSVASIGTALARKGYRVLLVDLDAQANLTASLSKQEHEASVYDVLKGNTETLPVIQIQQNLSLLPSSLDMAGIELEISSQVSREYLLKDALELVAKDYDFCLLDCPPSLGLVTINALVSATDLFITLTAEALPSKGLAMLQKIVEQVKKRLNPSLVLSGVLITRWESSNLSKIVEEQLRGTFGDVVFNTRIRKNVSLAEAPLFSRDIFTHAPQSNGAKDYEAIAEEILQRTERN